MTDLPWYKDASKLFIAAGCIGAAVLFWFANGQPGTSLASGTYACQTTWQVGALPDGPAADVDNGEVVDAWDFDLGTGERSSVPFSNVERTDRKEFTMTSVNVYTGASGSFTCKL
ncbi:hypothetical protein [Demequina sp. NBRC 110051]|uniref:hypothetical protein n=1 Tax=Demequina sp. NBRC 110051 TaxID=1570340 RepID=UPI0009FBD1D1|nr:hypothetical protein [Demequina sp. NBRC 110051]